MLRTLKSRILGSFAALRNIRLLDHKVRIIYRSLENPPSFEVLFKTHRYPLPVTNRNTPGLGRRSRSILAILEFDFCRFLNFVTDENVTGKIPDCG